jgi:hypothetical protein
MTSVLVDRVSEGFTIFNLYTFNVGGIFGLIIYLAAAKNLFPVCKSETDLVFDIFCLKGWN